MRVVFVALVGITAVALAQEPPPAPAASHAETSVLEEITVTGTRIKRMTDFTTPTPTTVIDTSAMEQMGVINIGQAVTQDIPANISNFTPANTGNSSFFTGAYIPDLRGLNPFFGSRTLTLIDTRRAVQTGQGDQFDLNFVPQILLERIDTVTGGASAAYGSGAIAGVINIILDKKLEGGKINADLYDTIHNDGKDRHVAVAYGHGLFDDRVHFVIGGEYEKQDALGCQFARSWCARNAGLYQTGSVGATNVATYSLGSNLRNNIISPGGVLAGATTLPAALAVTADGANVGPYMGGVNPLGANPSTPVVNSTTVVGGQGEPLYLRTLLLSPLNRAVVTGMLTAKVTDSINFTADVNWGKVSSNVIVPGNTDQPTMLPQFGLSGQDIIGTSVTSTNPFTFQSTTFNTSPNAYIANNPNLLNPVNAGYNSLNKDWIPQVPLAADTSTTVRRFSAGLDGKYGDSSWVWDGYFEYGLTHREQFEASERRATSYEMALDSVLVNGQAECRVTAAGGVANVMNPTSPYYNPLANYAQNPALYATNSLLAQGCVPINPFGTQPVSPAALNYSFGYLDERLRYEQTVVGYNTSGNIFDGIGAGPFSMAAGVEWRQEVGHNDEVSCPANDAACQARIQDFAAQFGTPFGGRVTVEEGYLEVNLPVLKDRAWAHLLELDVAGRESRYSNKALYGYDVQNGVLPEATHNLTTWKISGFYDPIDGIRFRGSESHDSRAANFRELYYGQVLASGATGGFGYCSHPTSTNPFDDPCTENLVGNVNLRPETSDTTTVGLVFTPTSFPGLQFSADWFHIRLANAISAANTLEVELACTQGNAQSCSQMQFNPNYYLNGNVVPAGTPGALTGAAAWQAGVDNATSLTGYAFNGAFYDEKGVDFSLSYTRRLPDSSTLSIRGLTTWTGEQTYQAYPGGPVYNILGQTGAGGLLADFNPAPRWRGNLAVTWVKGGLSLTPMMNWVGRGTLNYAGVTPRQTDLYNKVANNDPAIRGYGYVLLPFNSVPSYFVLNLNTTYSFQKIGGLKGLQLWAQVNNVFNRKPPFAASPSFFNNAYAGTNPIYFDTLGLAWRAGFRLSF